MMNSSTFWSVYNRVCKKKETADFSVKSHPLTGDHGRFEVAVFENEAGKWCMEHTIERSNNSHHEEFASEEDCFSKLLRRYEDQLKKIGFPKTE